MPFQSSILNLRLRGGSGNDTSADNRTTPETTAQDAVEARYLELLRDCCAAVAAGSADLADGHLLLQRLRGEGRRPTLAVFNALLRVCAEAARAGRAAAADGERVVEQLLDEGLRPDAATHVAMLDVIAHGAAQEPPAGFLSDGYRRLRGVRRRKQINLYGFRE